MSSARGSIASLLELRERMNQLFDELVYPTEATSAPVAWVPAADVVETAETFEISVDLAGVDPGLVILEVAGAALTIRGTRSFPGETCEGVHRMERRYGPFLRTVELPVSIEGSPISRRSDEGVLRLSVRRARV